VGINTVKNSFESLNSKIGSSQKGKALKKSKPEDYSSGF
jgi:hypothetical protein